MKTFEARVLLHECSDMLLIPAHLSNNLKTFANDKKEHAKTNVR